MSALSENDKPVAYNGKGKNPALTIAMNIIADDSTSKFQEAIKSTN